MKAGRILICVVAAILLSVTAASVLGQDSTRTIHVFVALCDNEHQGIVPVAGELGNGEDPRNNLYWGALYGVKTFFRKSDAWTLISSENSPEAGILERCVFKHQAGEVYLVADAYKGANIEQTVTDFLESAAGKNKKTTTIKCDSENVTLNTGGNASLVAYVGHNGLMDFQIDDYPKGRDNSGREAIVLACASKSFFHEPLQVAKANPILWTTGLMAPEAYTLKSAIDGWILNESGEEIRTRAAKAYHRYQEGCSMRAARNLLVTGW